MRRSSGDGIGGGSQVSGRMTGGERRGPLEGLDRRMGGAGRMGEA